MGDLPASKLEYPDFYIQMVDISEAGRLCVPIQIAKTMYAQWDCEVQLLEQPNSIYAKTLFGQGSIQFKNGNSYEGETSRGLLHGKGIFKWASGVTFEGDFKHNVIQGKGKYTWPDGSTYLGDVVAGYKDGFGEFVSKAQNATYIGQWKKGQRNGKGRIEFGNGATFEGLFKDGLKCGFGRMVYPSGNFYEGMWQDDIKQGEGTMVWVTTNERYTGQWRSNKQHGHGTHVWVDSRADTKALRNRYEGQWVQGKREGYGTFFFSTGCRYEGYWHNNMKEGFGVMIEQNGEIKFGQYKADRLMRKEHAEILLEKTQPNQSTIVLPPLKNTIDSSIKDSKPLGQLKKVGKKPLQKIQKREDPKQTSMHNQQSPPKDQAILVPSVLGNTTILKNLQAEENPYMHYLDIENFSVTQSLRNFLLRSHSKIKHWYRQYSCTHEYFSGMSLEYVWRMMRQLKLIDAECNPSSLDRELARGYKSVFPLESQPQSRLILLQKLPFEPRQRDIYQLEIMYHSQQLYSQPFSWAWLEFGTELEGLIKVQNNPFQTANLYRGKQRNIHDPQNFLLFRQFVCALVRLAKLKYSRHKDSEADLKAALQKLFGRLSQHLDGKDLNNTSMLQENMKITTTDNMSLKSGFVVSKNVLDWARALNDNLFKEMTKHQRGLIGRIDQTITVRSLLRLLEKSQILKQPYEKMVFLEKVERYMDIKVGYFRKDLKPQAAYIISQLDKSPVFRPLLQLQLNGWEFNELVYIALTRKLSTMSNQDDVKQRYAEMIDSLLKTYQQSVRDAIPVADKIPRRKVQSPKDLLKKQMLEKLEQQRLQRLRLQELKKEADRAERERQLMEENDCDVASNAQFQESDDDMM